MAIKMEPAICTQCGAQVEVDPAKPKAVCQFCGTPFVVSAAIENYKAEYNQTYNTYNVHHAKKGVAESAFDFLDKQIERKEQRELRKQEKRRAMWKNIGLICLWLGIFPFMLCYWLYKTDKLSPKAKKAIAGGLAALVVISMIADAISGGSGEAGKEAAAKAPSMVNKASTEYVSLKDTDFAESTKTVTMGDITYQYPGTWTIEEQTPDVQYRHLLNGGGSIMVICAQRDFDVRGYNSFDALDSFYEGTTQSDSFDFFGYQKVLINGNPAIIADGIYGDDRAATLICCVLDNRKLFSVLLANQETISSKTKQNIIALAESAQIQ